MSPDNSKTNDESEVKYSDGCLKSLLHSRSSSSADGILRELENINFYRDKDYSEDDTRSNSTSATTTTIHTGIYLDEKDQPRTGAGDGVFIKKYQAKVIQVSSLMRDNYGTLAKISTVFSVKSDSNDRTNRTNISIQRMVSKLQV